MSAVYVLAIFRPRPGSYDAVLENLRVAIPRVHEEEGCELYAIADDRDGAIVMIEKWTSEALLDAHGDAAAVADLNAANEDLLLAPVEVIRLDPLLVGDPEKGAL